MQFVNRGAAGSASSRPLRSAALAVLAAAATVATIPGSVSAKVRTPSEASSGCSGQVAVVVASDERAQSDIYSAVTLAGVVGTGCIVLAGPRDGAMAAAQRARLNEAQGGGWIVGGTASVPEAKTAGRDMKRLAGQDRWHTARLVGAVAADPNGDISELTSQTAPRESPAVEPLPQIRNGAIAAGKSHTCALRSDSTITCWGDSRYGQTRTPAGTFTSVEAAGNNSFGIRVDKTLECWGNLQQCEALTSAGPYVVFDAASLDGSSSKACGIREGGTVECWDLFTGDRLNSPSGTFIDVSAGPYYSCGVRTDRTTMCWRSSASEETGGTLSGKYTSIAVGDGYACAIRTDGALKCWDPGTGADGASLRCTESRDSCTGELPDGTYVTSGCTDGDDRPIECSGIAVLLGNPEGRFLDIAGGEEHACAVAIDGITVCWGNNSRGQISAPEGHHIAVAAGDFHSCAIRVDQSTVCWGDDPSPIDHPVGSYKSIDAGHQHSCAIDSSGMLACWGQDNQGQIKSPSGTYAAIAAGRGHTCAIRSDKQISCRSNEDLGNLDTPTRTATGYMRNYPGTLDAPVGTFTAVAANQHSCAIRTDTTIACWGENITGRTDAPAGSYIVVALGNFHSCAIRMNHTVKCWGANDASDRSHGSRLGYGQASPRSGTYTAIAAGFLHTCAIRTGGAITCWGRTSAQTKPPSGTFTAIAVGDSHSCAIRTDGTIACWGSNQHGKATPPSGTYTSVAAGAAHSCAIRTNGTIDCWGQGGFGHTKPPKATFGLLIERSAPTTDGGQGVRIPPVDARGECDQDTTAVIVASDLAAQSDIYSAVTLAGVLGDACIVLAGARGEPMPADERARLNAAAPNGYVVGGATAVPDTKFVGKNIERLGGKDRWETARLVGEEASKPAM